jgi:hypothetical protein
MYCRIFLEMKHFVKKICLDKNKLQDLQYFSSIPVIHYLQAVLLIKIWTIFMSILYNTLKSGGTKDHFRRMKVSGTAPYWKIWTWLTSSHGGHRATTVSFHLVLSWAFLFASPHVVFMACSSEIKPLCHEFFGLPRFLFPWGFHSKTCFVMLLFAFLCVCPIHVHHLDLIVKLIGCCLSFSIVLYCWWYLATSLPR